MRVVLLSLCLSVSCAHASDLHLLIPGAAGGGWDLTARATGEALAKSGLVETVTFENMSGGGGGKAIAHLIETGRAQTLMVNSTPIVVRSLQGVFPQSHRDLTPIASMIGDYSTLVVRTQSPIQSLEQLAAIMRKEPRRVAIAGGSVTGGTDHIVATMVFSAMGTAPNDIKYIPYDAGGKAMGGLLSGEVQALSSGYGEVVDLLDQGYVRLLCVAALERQSFAPETPTCHEGGATGVQFVNWRGFFAAPNASPKQVERYQALLGELQETQAWQQIRSRYGWVELYRPAEHFTALLNEQEQTLRVQLKELGLL